jgi:Zn finger protein HypA/HybF involved in hydrogenase expression
MTVAALFRFWRMVLSRTGIGYLKELLVQWFRCLKLHQTIKGNQTVLYCPHCDAYQGSLGSEVCASCGHSEEVAASAESRLYCPDCNGYLGSIGATSCSCGWPQQYKTS